MLSISLEIFHLKPDEYSLICECFPSSSRRRSCSWVCKSPSQTHFFLFAKIIFCLFVKSGFLHNKLHLLWAASKKSVCPAKPPPHRFLIFQLLLVQMGYGLLSGRWVLRRKTNRWPCCPPMSNTPKSSWAARPDVSGRWDNWVAAQHLPRDLMRHSSCKKNGLKRRKSDVNLKHFVYFFVTDETASIWIWFVLEIALVVQLTHRIYRQSFLIQIH